MNSRAQERHKHFKRIAKENLSAASAPTVQKPLSNQELLKVFADMADPNSGFDEIARTGARIAHARLINDMAASSSFDVGSEGTGAMGGMETQTSGADAGTRTTGSRRRGVERHPSLH